MSLSLSPNLQLIYVSDIERSCDFYKTIFNAKPIFESPRYVAFSADASGEALFAIWSGGATPDNVPRFSEIGLMLSSSEDVDRIYENWKMNPVINVLQEPSTEIFGRTFLIQDPDGHVIRVCQRD